MTDNYISHLRRYYYRKFKDRMERNSFAGTGGWIIGGRGGKGMLAPPLKLLGGPGPPWTPSSYAYDWDIRVTFQNEDSWTQGSNTLRCYIIVLWIWRPVTVLLRIFMMPDFIQMLLTSIKKATEVPMIMYDWMYWDILLRKSTAHGENKSVKSRMCCQP